MKETFVQTLWLGKIAWKQAKQISPRNATLQSDDGDDDDDDDFTPWTILWPFFSFHSLSMNGKKKNIRNSECPGWLVTHVRNDPFRSFFDLFAGMILSFLESDPLDASVGMQNWITSARIFNSWIFMAGGEWINSQSHFDRVTDSLARHPEKLREKMLEVVRFKGFLSQRFFFSSSVDEYQNSTNYTAKETNTKMTSPQSLKVLILI